MTTNHLLNVLVLSEPTRGKQMLPSVLDHIIEATSARPRGRDRWLGHGVCHGSKRNRDFSIFATQDRILIHCFAACGFSKICHALGIEPAQLFFDAPLSRAKRLVPKPICPARRRFALDLEFHALALKERAEGVLRRATNQDTATWTDHDFDAAMQTIGKAHDDLAYAEVLLSVSDSQREKAYEEGR